MRKSVVYVLLLLLFESTVYAGVDTQYLQGMGDVRYHHLDSKVIERAYHVYVSLPNGYNTSSAETYPTIYLLDGGLLFPMLSAYYGYLNAGGEVPRAIIVGISYGSNNFEDGNYRSTDYTAPSTEREYWGGAEQFQQFLSDTLMPFIESNYNSRVDRRVIFGQSIGGQLVLYTALTKPNLFWGHVASNPALHRNLPFYLRTHAEPEAGNDRSRLFIGDGTLNDLRFRGPSQEFMEYWADRDDKPWALKTMDLAGHSHMSAPPASFRQGLHWLFSEE